MSRNVLLRAIKTHEFFLAVFFGLLIVLIGSLNPAFFSLANLFDLLKSSAVNGIFALGVFVVLLSGGIDISFTAVAVVSMYVANRIVVAAEYEGSCVLVFAIAAAIGLLLGCFNAVFISFFRLPTLIVTLGTASLYRGFLLAFVGTAIINQLPPGLVSFSRMALFRHQGPDGEWIGLSCAFIVFLLAVIVTAVVLRYTMLGRSVYAIGGNEEAARRAGFRIAGVRFFIYGFVGLLSGIAGTLHAAMMRNANPFDLVGTELTVIAAVVLGGASIHGGRGTVFGAVLGVMLVVTISNSLILLGIPSYWQLVVTGSLIIASTAVSVRAYRFDQTGGRA